LHLKGTKIHKKRRFPIHDYYEKKTIASLKPSSQQNFSDKPRIDNLNRHSHKHYQSIYPRAIESYLEMKFWTTTCVAPSAAFPNSLKSEKKTNIYITNYIEKFKIKMD
jgi:hypothetical protein